MQYPLRSFAPDLDPLTPGVITDSDAMYPTVKGLRALPDLLPATQPLPNPCLGTSVLSYPNGPQWIVAGSGDDGGGSAALHAMSADAPNQAAPTAWAKEPLAPTIGKSHWRFDMFGMTT